MAELVFDAAFLAQLEQLRLQLNRHAAGQTGGGRKSRHMGQSVEFSDFRDYQLGDDFRRVDWNAYARLDRLMLKLFMEEKQMQIRLFLDVSDSMSIEGQNKLKFAKQLCATMAYLGLAAYDEVSVLLVGNGIIGQLPARVGKNQLMSILNFLENAPQDKKADWLRALQQANIRGNGVSVIFSDGFNNDGWEKPFRFLQYCKQDVTFIQILSPQEIEPSYEGQLRLIDSEDQTNRDLQFSHQLLMLYQKNLQSFMESLKEQCHVCGFSHTMIRSDLPLQQAVFERLLVAFDQQT